MKKLITTLLSLFLLMSLQAVAQEEEPLDPDKAFALEVSVVDADTIQATWTIADGYYLYRSKLRFESQTDGITFGEPQLPPGKIKHDEFFGDVETYRGTLTVTVPVKRATGAGNTLKFKATSQGCADIGICYPPQRTSHELVLPEAAPAAITSDASSALTGMDDGLGMDGEEDILDVDQAFRFDTEVRNGNLIIARWQIAPKHYLYKDKFTFKLTDADGVTLDKVQLPPGEEKDDEFFGRIEVYHDLLEAYLPLKRSNLDPTRVTLQIGYQGCAEAGICYQPQNKSVTLELPAAKAATGTDTAGDTQPAPGADSGVSMSDAIGAVLFAFVIGFGLTFTPCVLPMIPILSSIIVGQSGEKASPMRGGVLSTIYVLGTAVTYTAVGILAGATGDQLQAYFQNPWAIGTFATILVLLALSMFGFYEIQLPSSLQSKLQEKSAKLQGGTAAGVFIMGLISAAIVGACVSPGLISVLGIAMKSQDPVLGGAIMFSMALGMGVVLIAIGFGMGGLMPKAGAWMDNVKYTFGVLLLGVAIYLLGILPQVPVLYLWAALFIITGVYMGATQPIAEASSRWSYLWKGIGTLLIIWGLFALLGAFAGNRDILRPIDISKPAVVSSVSSPAASSAATQEGHALMFQRVASLEELKARMAEARTAAKPVLIDFYADWCTDCLRMEKGTFSDPRVQQLLAERFMALQIDVTENDDRARELKRYLNVFGPPAILFFDADGKPLTSHHFYGYMPAEEFLDHINKAYRQ